jgi:enoyl-CoA hydratase/carnithine racemase
LIELRNIEAVPVLTMTSGRVNAMDVELLTELTDCVRDLRQRGANALVITGAGAVFSAGVDLFQVLDRGPAYIDELITALSVAFEAVFSFPAPTVAAINGAAIAGGCVLACACDWRIIQVDAPIGASELRVGVPFPAAALEVLNHACGDHAQTVIFSGQLYRGADAVVHRLVDETVDTDVVGRAIEAATDRLTIPADCYRLAKAQLRRPTLDRIGAADDDDEVRRIWSAPETAARIRAHLDRMRRGER